MNRREFASVMIGAAALADAAHSAAAGKRRGAMRQYVYRIRGDLRRFRQEQLAATNAAGERLAGRIASGGKLFIYDSRGCYSAEATGRAGGLMAIERLSRGAEGELTSRDALIIVSDRPAADEDLAVARQARARGALVVAICPVRDDANSLASACEIALDNYVTDEDAAIPIEGMAERIAPTSGVLNSAILWTLTAAYIESMERLGKPPHVWLSIKRPGAKQFNAAARAAAKEAGY